MQDKVQELIKEINKNLDKQEKLRQKMSSLKHGKLVIRQRNGSGYYYLEYRKGNKVINEYVGKVNTGEIDKFLKEEKEYYDTKFEIGELKIREDEIKRTLRKYGVRHYRTIYTLYEIKKILKPIFKKYGVKKALLFGSYSRGEANINSDFDLIVDKVSVGDSFELKEDIKEATGKDVDLIYDGSSVTKVFLKEIKKDLIQIYGN